MVEQGLSSPHLKSRRVKTWIRATSSLSPVFALVCCAHVPPSAYIGWQFPSPGSSGQLQADSSLLLASLQVVASLV